MLVSPYQVHELLHINISHVFFLLDLRDDRIDNFDLQQHSTIEIEVLDEEIEKFSFYVDHCSFVKRSIHQDVSVVEDHCLYGSHV